VFEADEVVVYRYRNNFERIRFNLVSPYLNFRIFWSGYSKQGIAFSSILNNRTQMLKFRTPIKIQFHLKSNFGLFFIDILITPNVMKIVISILAKNEYKSNFESR
jgi:hypothetical protein